MNKTSCPQVSFDFTSRFLPPVYILVFIIGLVANGFGLKSLLQNWKKLKIINVFVFNLGLADILYLLTLPFLVVYYFMKSKWIFGDTFCKITRFCFNMNLYGSIGFFTCISVSRYLAIVHPVRVIGRLTASHSVAVSVVVWLLVSTQSLPDMFGFCLPFLITLGCYGHVIVTLCRSSSTDRVLKQRSLRLLFILIVLFSVCYIPYHILRNLNLWSRVLHVNEEVSSQLRKMLGHTLRIIHSHRMSSHSGHVPAAQAQITDQV